MVLGRTTLWRRSDAHAMPYLAVPRLMRAELGDAVRAVGPTDAGRREVRSGAVDGGAAAGWRDGVVAAPLPAARRPCVAALGGCAGRIGLCLRGADRFPACGIGECRHAG